MLNGTGTEDDIDLNTLWHRMLAIQRVFGCYNSARMRAALDSGVEDEFVRTFFFFFSSLFFSD